jgi:transcriptional regulator with XRE-family HTH domain
LKISSVAKYAGMNAALLRQYASGVKSPSSEQAKKIEKALHSLEVELSEASVV